jgi:GAF domain-containing protein
VTWRNLKRLERILSAVGRSSRYLLKKEDSRETLRSLLSDLGQSVDVSRVYIFRHERILDDEVISSQIMEWTAEGIEPESENPQLQNFPMIEGGFQRWVDTLERGDPVYGNVKEFPEGEQKILKPQGIKSILVVPLFIEKRWWGFVGFDDCVRRRKWMDEEIAALTTASRLIENVIISEDSS